jgi:hypothetical protein
MTSLQPLRHYALVALLPFSLLLLLIGWRRWPLLRMRLRRSAVQPASSLNTTLLAAQDPASAVQPVSCANRMLRWTELGCCVAILMDWWALGLCWELSTEQPLDLAASVTALVAFAFCAGLTVLELLANLPSSHALRLWWLAYAAVACCRAAPDVEALSEGTRVPPDAAFGRLAGACAALLLALAAMLESDGRGESVAHEEPSRQLAPDAGVSFFSALSFGWIHPTLALGAVRPLEMGDMCPLGWSDTSACNSARLGRTIADQRRRHGERAVFVSSLFRAYGGQFVPLGVLAGVSVAATLTTPLLINRVITYVQGDAPHLTRAGAYGYAGLLLVVPLVRSVASAHLYFWSDRVGLRIKVALGPTIFDKALRCDPQPAQSPLHIHAALRLRAVSARGGRA